MKLTYFKEIGPRLNEIKTTFENLHVLSLKYVTLPFSIAYLFNELTNEVRRVKISYCHAAIKNMENPSLVQNLNMEKLILNCRQDLGVLDILEAIDTTYPNLRSLQYEAIGGELTKSFEKNINKLANEVL